MGRYNNQTGAIGERAAANFLRDKGYKLLSVNYKTRFGEIDIIAQKGEYIVFAEVKTRGINAIAQPREFVGKGKQQKIIRAALSYMQYSRTELQPRFDVLEVFTDIKGNITELKHIENAFDGSCF